MACHFVSTYDHRDLHSFPTRRSSDLPERPNRVSRVVPNRLQPHRTDLPHGHERLRHPAEIAQGDRSEEHTSELQSRRDLVCRLLLEKKILCTDNMHHLITRSAITPKI